MPNQGWCSLALSWKNSDYNQDTGHNYPVGCFWRKSIFLYQIPFCLSFNETAEFLLTKLYCIANSHRPTSTLVDFIGVTGAQNVQIPNMQSYIHNQVEGRLEPISPKKSEVGGTV